MAIEVTVVRDLAALRGLETEWRSLAGMGPSVLFRGPDWLIPWWLAYHRTLHAELHVLVGRATEPDGAGTVAGDMVCLAPLYRRTVRVALLDSRELRMMGDAGPRPPSLDLLARPGWEDRAGQALARMLIEDAPNWDLIDLEPLADPSRDPREPRAAPRARRVHDRERVVGRRRKPDRARDGSLGDGACDRPRTTAVHSPAAS